MWVFGEKGRSLPYPQMVRQDLDIESVRRGLGGPQVSSFATEQSSGVLHDHGHQPGLSIPAPPPLAFMAELEGSLFPDW